MQTLPRPSTDKRQMPVVLVALRLSDHTGTQNETRFAGIKETAGLTGHIHVLGISLDERSCAEDSGASCAVPH